jgi:3-dehydroquinate synthetase/shikimate kinase
MATTATTATAATTTTSTGTTTVQPLVPPVVLLGPPGAGKSTVGAHVARRLGFGFVDLDERVGIGTLRREGETGFRVREVLALRDALDEGAVVIAPGAGIVDTAAGRELLARACCVVVDVGVDDALARIPDGTRPWLPDRDVGPEARRAAWSARESGRDAHRRALGGDQVVNGDGPVDVVADRVVEALRRWSFQRAPVAVADTLVLPAGFVVADRVVAHHLPRVDLVVDDAARKDREQLFFVLRALVRAGVTRADRIVAVGGGALLDVVGLAAALYHRGTPWVAVPTTLLAMVDAGLGGKTAIDLLLTDDGADERDDAHRAFVAADGGPTVVVRNAVGAIHAPLDTIVWPGFLASLSADQQRHGRAEMVKHALLTGGVDDVDAAARGPLDAGALAASLGVKRFVVDRDPDERHLRHALNLGHTFAHALEARFGIAHGDAVLHGLRAMLGASVALAALPIDEANALTAALARLAVPPLPRLGHDDNTALVRAMRRDKKARGAARPVRLVLLGGARAPGRVVLADAADDVVLAALGGG